MGERFLDTEEVTSSILVSPTLYVKVKGQYSRFGCWPLGFSGNDAAAREPRQSFRSPVQLITPPAWATFVLVLEMLVQEIQVGRAVFGMAADR